MNEWANKVGSLLSQIVFQVRGGKCEYEEMKRRERERESKEICKEEENDDDVSGEMLLSSSSIL